MNLQKPTSPSRRPARRRLVWPRFSKNSDTRSIQIGVLATLLVHLFLALILPRLALRTPAGAPPVQAAQERTFNIELQPEDVPPSPETPERKKLDFVEVNPDAPDNPPDDTQFFGAQNQQVAQEKPSPENKGDVPRVEGDKEKESTAIVTGRLEKIELTPPSAAEQAQAQVEAVARAQRPAQAPLPGFEKIEGETPDNTGSTVAKLPAPDTPRGPEKVEGDSNIREVVAFDGRVVQIDPRRPQQRARVPEQNVRPAFLRDNPMGTSNIGPIAYNAKWSEYGEYLKRLIETVQIQWERINAQSASYPPAGTMVEVKFTINDEGRITYIEADRGGSPLQAKRACVSAITERAPYGKWTDDMIAVLGNEQELTFRFFYY